MTFSLSILLIPYFILLFVWFLFSIVAVYHMVKYGFKTFATFFSIFLYIGVSLFILVFSYLYINKIDWNVDVAVFDGILNNERVIEEF